MYICVYFIFTQTKHTRHRLQICLFLHSYSRAKTIYYLRNLFYAKETRRDTNQACLDCQQCLSSRHIPPNTHSCG